MFTLMNLIIRLCQIAMIYIAICETTFESVENCPSWNYRKYLDN